MADMLATFRSMLDRPLPIEEAIAPYLGSSPQEANRHADAEATGEGLRTDRLRGLVTILALREAPPALATLVAALLWRSAPVASDIDELYDAIHRISDWRMGLSDDDVARIVRAHRTYNRRFEEVFRETGQVRCPETEALLRDLACESIGDHVLVEIGGTLLIVEMTDSHYFVGIQEEGGPFIVIDSIPHVGGGGWDRDDEGGPDGPRPLVLQDS